MADLILKNLYHNNKKVPMMFNNGDFLYRCVTKLIFSVDTDNLFFNPSGETKTINITANDNWSMTIPSWLTASVLSGTGNATVSLTAAATEENKDGEVIITCQDRTHSIDVKQLASNYLYFKNIDSTSGEVWFNRDVYLGWTGITYSRDLQTWNNVFSSSGNAGNSFKLQPGSTIYFCGTGNTIQSASIRYYRLGSSVECEIGGDLTTFYGNEPGEYAFYNLFSVSSTKIKDASNLVLPNNIAPHMCKSMFSDCRSLTTAPSLPATTLAQACYSGMFSGCTSLATAPELPATTLANSCYYQMFEGCTSLTIAPALPATTLADGCYFYMFAGCTSLTAAPDLPATALTQECYSGMFSGCTSLNYLKCMAKTNINNTRMTSYWLKDTAANGTLYKPAGVTWEVDDSGYLMRAGIPPTWTQVDIT